MNSLFPLSGANIGRAERVGVARSLCVFLSQPLKKLLDGFLKFILIDKDSAEVEMRRPVARFVFDGFAMMGRGFVKFAFAFEGHGVIVMRLRIVWVETQTILE